MDDHFDICREFEISKFDIARLTCIKKSDVENLKNLFLFYELLYNLSEKRIKIWGHRTNSLLVGPNLTPPP